MQPSIQKTYHSDKVVICIGVFFECQDELWKAGVELHNSVKVPLIILVNSVRVVSAYIVFQ